MEYEYVALTWGSEHPRPYTVFSSAREALRDLGWEECVRALLPASSESGACIMRRPKDEACMTFAELREAMKDIWLRFPKEESNG